MHALCVTNECDKGKSICFKYKHVNTTLIGNVKVQTQLCILHAGCHGNVQE